MQLEDWLDDLCVRFIVNIPAEELAQIERICFQIEEAQWFYEDFIRPLDPSLPSLTLKPFFQRITQRCPIFQHWPQEDMANAFEKFLKYKNRVPVRGVILLNERMDQVLLVKGWKKSGTWSFPRGKINKDEDDLDCAIREAWEETGFDISAAGLAKDRKNIKHIERTLRSQNMKLFIFRGVPQDAHFVPQTRKEISKVQWFKLSELPTEKKRTQQEGTGQHLVLNANKFYVVAPFIGDLKKYINAQRKRDNRQSSKLAAPPMTVDAASTTATDPYTAFDPQMVGPMSPPIPSNLPEVTPASIHDPVMHLMQRSDFAARVLESDTDTATKAKALLSLLHQGPAAELRDDPHTPMDHLASAKQPLSAQHSAYFMAQHGTINILSPPSSYDLHPQAHPGAPPASAVPQLTRHTKSLLDVLTNPTFPPSPAAKQQLPGSKQSLLAAFTSTSNAPRTDSTPSTGNQAGNSLLQLLQGQTPAIPRATPVPEPDRVVPLLLETTMNAATSHGHQIPGTGASAHTPANTLLALLQRQAPAASSIPSQSVKPAPLPDSPATASASIDNQQAKDYIEIAELSATSDHDSKNVSTPKTKNDLLSLLGTMPPTAHKVAELKSRSGTTAATLDRPIDEPQFDAIPRTTTFEEEPKRDPVSSGRKLFDPRHDSARPSPAMKVLSKQEERPRQSKPPRATIPKQANSPRRPGTPKEPAKPFQPQILRRPQTSDGDSTVDSLTLLTRNSVAVQESVAILPRTTSVAHGPLSPSLDAPQPVMKSPPPEPLSTSRSPSMVQDPQRLALLSLLRTPTQKTAIVDTDVTHRGVSDVPQVPRDGIISPPTPGQLVSPVMEAEHGPSVPRSRVSSLASTGNGIMSMKSPVERKQTAAGDKAFLMQYLKGFANREAV